MEAALGALEDIRPTVPTRSCTTGKAGLAVDGEGTLDVALVDRLGHEGTT